MNLEIGKNLKTLRRQKDLTQDELAAKLSLSVQAISRYETGAAYPDIQMLPIIAGFFGVTVDQLLGVSGEAKERRKDEYLNELRKITDRKDRLALLRKQHAEFPEDWDVVSDMVYEMTYIPECLDEMRDIVEDAVKNCNDNLWRENMIFFYIQSEQDEEKANAFIEKHASRYDMRKTKLLDNRYSVRREFEKLKTIRQKSLIDELEDSLYRLAERIDGNIPVTYENCRRILSFIEHFSCNSDRTKPDMWVSMRLRILLSIANNCFRLANDEEGFAFLNDAVTLFENFFSLENGTVLTYGSPLFDQLSARTKKEVFYQITEFSGMIATSMMMNLVYQTPIGPVDEEAKFGYNMEGFKCSMVFSDHIYKNVLKNASWDGFARVKEDPRYIELAERAKKASSVESIDNLMYFINSHRYRTDDYASGKKWVCALLVKDVGAYIVYDDAADIEEKFSRMQREGNTFVYRVAAAEIGGSFIEPPRVIKQRLLALNEDNKNADVVLQNSNNKITFTAL